MLTKRGRMRFAPRLLGQLVFRLQFARSQPTRASAKVRILWRPEATPNCRSRRSPFFFPTRPAELSESHRRRHVTLLGRRDQWINPSAKGFLAGLSSGSISSSAFAASTNIPSSRYPLETRTCSGQWLSRDWRLLKEEEETLGCDPSDRQKGAGSHSEDQQRAKVVIV
jgi:hypothetical protein